jgi:hypothetical protein
MPGLVPGIHVLGTIERNAWMAGTKPGHDGKPALAQRKLDCFVAHDPRNDRLPHDWLCH